ncbi:MAG TPA: PQQ-binding-like beta-propeller repeat protein, partial [Opitutaceae bacterium]
STGLDNGLSSSLALAADGTVYFHDDDGHLYAVNSSGALEWTAPVSGVSYAAPTIAPDGTVYVGNDGGHLYAFNADGSAKWTFTTPVAAEEIYTAAAIDSGGNLYVGTLSGNFYSVTPAGALRWTYATGASISSAPALADGAVYFGGYDGNLYSLAASSGALNWKYPLGTQVRASAPAVDANGVVYIGCYDHSVYAIGQSGSLVRTYVTDDYIRSSPVINGTSLCFGSEDHKLYEFDIGTGPAASDWPMYQFSASRLGRAVAAAITIVTQPSSQFVAPGSPFTLSVGAVGQGAITYQWNLNGTPIAGAMSATYSVAAASAADSGSYTVTVTSPAGTVTSASAVVTVSLSTGRLANIATRALVGTGANIEIAGISITGPAGTFKQVLIRGDGPALGIAPFGIAGALASTSISVFDNSGNVIVSNTGWGNPPVATSSAGRATFRPASANDMSDVGAFSLGAGSADSALVADLPPGNYTVELSGPGPTTGVGLLEVYEMNAADPAVMTNIATRAEVEGGGSLLIGGFYVGGTGPATLLVRGSGPALALAPFSLSGTLTHPVLEIYDSTSTPIARDAGWANAPTNGTSGVNAIFRAASASDMAAAGAFAFGAGSLDSAIVITLPPGAYTAEVTSGDGTNGIGLVEVYLLP